ncbi:hypothetical protein Pmar_PMAR004515 [Perkinsus marinus ATCC 50983]|uniref:Uncharacterized protein n=1 Tax=Perkinsus marinus (strain ATCC 50983 / TXsc) TaxID=423536 RepID=C5LZV8_PERM5|nr:hypothetical protein Pmar_PMAR004515 [Perkinsus marinus ATCC 50983]EEQ97776.1 hypothetical protein Pmar_PMAR004515 [Perkinsus marinus ATCC 50983]|eukprot:XP_002765059.1 hypothetical protein Pmar_PMAR004515 [Perkinsus marinus ATCC 50983]
MASPHLLVQAKDIPPAVIGLQVDRTTVYSQDSRFWIQFDVDPDSEEFLVLRAAVCPLRRELVYGVSKLV